MREVLFTTVTSLLITPFILVSLHIVGAQAMQSASYRIESDSVNFGGGLATSTNYSLESTGGEVATGESSSTNYGLKAGYQQMQEVYISITGAANVTLSPSIPGVSGGVANGSTTLVVTTDSSSGYELLISAENSPAMQKGGDTIADYVTQGSDPDFAFITNAADAHFGYSPTGSDITDRYKDFGGVCNSGSGDTAEACWDGLTTSGVAIARSGSANHPIGATTTIDFRVGIGGSVVQPAGTYTATTTLTALPL